MLLARLQRESLPADEAERERHPHTSLALGAQLLRARVARARRRAQKPIADCEHSGRKRQVRRYTRELVAKIRYRPKRRGKDAADDAASDMEPTYGEAARNVLLPLAEEVLNQPLSREQELPSWHARRLAAKQLRYAMELFAGSLEPAHRQRCYAVVEEVQERLGTINDHAVAAARFAVWKREARHPAERAWLKELMAREEHALRECQADWEAWWSDSRSDEFRQAFHAALARGAPPRVAK